MARSIQMDIQRKRLTLRTDRSVNEKRKEKDTHVNKRKEVEESLR